MVSTHNVPKLIADGRIAARSGPWLDAAPPTPARTDPDRLRGMLLGVAIGDALGNTTEAQNPDERRATHGWITDYLPNRYADGRRAGLPSDDTQMTFWTIEHLLKVGRLDPEQLMADFASETIFGQGTNTSEAIQSSGHTDSRGGLGAPATER